MRKAIAIVVVALLLPLGLLAQSNEELMRQIEALKQQLQALESKVSAQQQAAPAPQAEMQKLDERLTKVETKTAGDNISWGGDIRVRYDNQSWTINPYGSTWGDRAPVCPSWCPCPATDPTPTIVHASAQDGRRHREPRFNGHLSIEALRRADVPLQQPANGRQFQLRPHPHRRRLSRRAARCATIPRPPYHRPAE
jgi:hypothetical protein